MGYALDRLSGCHIINRETNIHPCSDTHLRPINKNQGKSGDRGPRENTTHQAPICSPYGTGMSGFYNKAEAQTAVQQCSSNNLLYHALYTQSVALSALGHVIACNHCFRFNSLPLIALQTANTKEMCC